MSVGIRPANRLHTGTSLGMSDTGSRLNWELPQATLARGFLIPVSEISEEWEVVSPFYLTVEEDGGGGFIAGDERISVYGEGSTELEAVSDYLTSLVEYYELLEARRGTNAHNFALFTQVTQLIGRTSSQR